MAANTKVLHLPSVADFTPEHWSWSRLDEVSQVVDCPHSTPKLAEFGPLMVRSQDMRTGVFRTENAARVTEETYQERISRAEPRYGDVLYSREGTYFGIAAEVPPNTRICLGQRMVLIRPTMGNMHFQFLKYWLNSEEMAGYIHGFRDGTVAERLNMSTIRALSVPRPPLPEQKAIAHILGTLDDKIELNRQMNQTLEAMARAIFKSWFVDFDPVRAKMNSEPYPLDAETLALFPDRFVDSALGEIPEGWEVKRVGEITEAVGGGTPSTKNADYWDGGIHCFATPKDLSGLSSPILLSTGRRVTDAGLAKISSGLLPIGTVLMSSRAPVGYLALAQTPVCINQGFIAMRCDGSVSNYYMLHWCASNMDVIKSNAGGTTFAEISKRNFRPIPALVPSSEIVTAFDAYVGPMYERIQLNDEESRTLAELRDTLLPKLISGELRMPKMEEVVG